MECFICFETPCECIDAGKKGAASKSAARSLRRSPVHVESRKPVTRFSSTEKVEESQDSGQGDLDDEDEMMRCLRLLAPLLSESCLRENSKYLPVDWALTVDERCAKFRAAVPWSESRYDVSSSEEEVY